MFSHDGKTGEVFPRIIKAEWMRNTPPPPPTSVLLYAVKSFKIIRQVGILSTTALKAYL